MNLAFEKSATDSALLVISGTRLAVAGLVGSAVACLSHRVSGVESLGQYVAELGPFVIATFIGIATTLNLEFLRRFESALMLSVAVLFLAATSAAMVHLIAERDHLDVAAGRQTYGDVLIGLNGLYAFILSLLATNDGLVGFIVRGAPMTRRIDAHFVSTNSRVADGDR